MAVLHHDLRIGIGPLTRPDGRILCRQINKPLESSLGLGRRLPRDNKGR
jgi:hypothetical protein